MAPELPSAELRALAEAIRHGDHWLARSQERRWWPSCEVKGTLWEVWQAEDPDEESLTGVVPYNGGPTEAVAHYIAAANPSAILALLDRLATAEVARDEATALLRESWGDDGSPCNGDLDDHVQYEPYSDCDHCGQEWPCLTVRVTSWLAVVDAEDALEPIPCCAICGAPGYHHAGCVAALDAGAAPDSDLGAPEEAPTE